MKAPVHSPTVLQAIDRLQQLAGLFQRRREQLARRVGLTVQQWQVLDQITGDEPFMPSLFARERESSRAAVSKILRQLQDKGLITAGVSPANGRHREYELTAEGRRVMEELRAHREHAIREVWSAIDERQLQWFIYFSNGLISRLESYAQDEE